ncbi:MAG: hypothetical protein HY904_05745 [Deltaproteobacteria bacterium]|nr:hypothetical protein [Deltaproteobacteria bacterium]
MSGPPSEEKGGFGNFTAQKTFPCEACGAQLTFAIDAQKLKCGHCGAEKDLQFQEGASVSEQDLNAALQKQSTRRRTATAAPVTHEVKCTSCGATVAFSGTLTSTECAYCGTPIQREAAHEAQDRLPVDGVCPFAVEKDTAQRRLQDWVGSRWFAPGDFKQRGVHEHFQGVYMPYFTFDAMTHSRYRGERGDAYYETEGEGQNKRQVRKVRWTPRAGALRRFFDDVCIPALRSLPRTLLQSLEPWPLTKLIPFTDQALAGKQAHTYELELSEGFAAARERMDDEIRSDVRGDIGGDEQRIHDVTTQFSALTYKHVLLPIWILAYRYREKTYRVVVNAMTGEVQGERPWSAVKIALAVIAGAVVAYVLFRLGGSNPHAVPAPR